MIEKKNCCRIQMKFLCCFFSACELINKEGGRMRSSPLLTAAALITVVLLDAMRVSYVMIIFLPSRLITISFAE